jgi:hypothetical protein
MRGETSVIICHIIQSLRTPVPQQNTSCI